MSKNNDTIINASDFETVILKINLTNVTTQSEIKDGKRSFGTDENLTIQISEFLDNGLMLEIPSKSCAQNHTIMLELSTENTDVKINFKENLKVLSVEKISQNSDLIETAFIQKNEKEWEKLQSLYNKRQEEIRNFINSVKGYEST